MVYFLEVVANCKTTLKKNSISYISQQTVQTLCYTVSTARIALARSAGLCFSLLSPGKE